MPGEEIEVIVRYRGQEFTMTQGRVEMVNLDREVMRLADQGTTMAYGLSGIETLTIVVRR